jgi:predicted hotdog family 3-hydroxylacyl-ACP dehydratase
MLAEALPTSAAEHVPHVGDAVLLSTAWAEDEQRTLGRATVLAAVPFADTAGGWPPWMLVELMAQLVAAGAGIREFRPGVRPRLGLLLGVRDFRCTLPHLVTGTELLVEALEGMRDESGMGVFDCTVAVGSGQVASAILSVYLPDDVAAYLESLEP